PYDIPPNITGHKRKERDWATEEEGVVEDEVRQRLSILLPLLCPIQPHHTILSRLLEHSSRAVSDTTYNHAMNVSNLRTHSRTLEAAQQAGRLCSLAELCVYLTRLVMAPNAPITRSNTVCSFEEILNCVE